MLTKAQMATLKAADMEDDVSASILGSSSMNPTSMDWSEIMECEEATENQQKKLKTNDLYSENSTAMGMEGSGNLYDERLGDYKEFKETKQNQSAKEKAPEPSQEIDDKRPENPYKNNNQGPEAQGNAPDTGKGQPNIDEENSSPQNLSRQEIVTGKKDVQMSESGVIPETEKIQLNPNNNKRVSPISTGLVTGTIESLNKANIIPNNFMASRSNKDWRQNDISYDQQKLIVGTTGEIAQPIADEGFTEVLYSKKNKNKANSNRRQILGPYKKSKTSGQ
ncbi:18143_t:CDS:2 [Gigaspora margarita]|uniref:18143_t:CDS:1 n=1 Tax=Gigaspora margarita TaxID=4874 RepID=A0ABN7UKM4_GIGMA|nr:18143_t:CDS:2 [Gigaspora margarita]